MENGMLVPKPCGAEPSVASGKAPAVYSIQYIYTFSCKFDLYFCYSKLPLVVNVRMNSVCALRRTGYPSRVYSCLLPIDPDQDEAVVDRWVGGWVFTLMMYICSCSEWIFLFYLFFAQVIVQLDICPFTQAVIHFPGGSSGGTVPRWSSVGLYQRASSDWPGIQHDLRRSGKLGHCTKVNKRMNGCINEGKLNI